ncbi:hypothetical protein [Streptomyces sp. LN590]|uniref:hypothetical protein n=1 Tax=Streptomyces sp. LN590 TaxID=3112980 RepID=UPI00371B0EDE
MPNDTFRAECRAREEAARGQQADESACGTCRGNVANGKQVEHDGCARRTLLLEPPDMPSYDVLIDMDMAEREALPARFHVPVFDDLGKPNAWLCRVCWTEGVVTSWPCNTAMKHGAQVFTPIHDAELQHERQTRQLAELTEQVEQARRIAVALEQENARLTTEKAELDKVCDEVMRERDGLHDALDQFAQAVAPEDVIGEHSSGNNPWANALELVTPMVEVDKLRADNAELEKALGLNEAAVA